MLGICVGYDFVGMHAVDGQERLLIPGPRYSGPVMLVADDLLTQIYPTEAKVALL